MTRQRSALRAPAEGQASRLPALKLPIRVARATDARHRDPWWFSSRTSREDVAGRFDLRAPRGTCYLADDPAGALAEKLIDPDDIEPVVTHDALDRVAVWTGELQAGDVADTTSRASRMSKELGTVTPYVLPWAWADACDGEGRDGLVAWLRLDPGPGRGLALFADASPTAEDVWRTRCDLGTRAPAMSWLRQVAEVVDVVDVPALRDVEDASTVGAFLARPGREDPGS